jgi:acetyl esterase/lipase
MKSILTGLFVLMIFTLAACSRPTPVVETQIVQTQEIASLPEATPTPAVMADTFFSGRAYVDSNSNRQLDETDPPLPGARFSVMGFGSLTDQDGYAWAMIPGGWDEPVTARMDPPENSDYTLIGPVEVTLQAGRVNSVDFLFAPAGTPSLTPPPTSPTPGKPAPVSTVSPTAPASHPAGPTATVLPPGAHRSDVTYCTSADGTKLKMDIYPPQNAEAPAPVVVYVHGGGWMSGSKNDDVARDYFGELTQRGFLVASLNYRLAPKYLFPAQIEDVKCAIRHLRANALSYNLDPDHIGAMGGSAGGHLVSLLGTTDPSAGWDIGEYPEQSSRIQAVIHMYGPSDLLALFKNWQQPVGEQVFGAASNTDPLMNQYSPVTYITPDDPPFLILQGVQDGVVPTEQAQILYDRLSAAGVPVQLVMVENAGHGLKPKGGDMQPSLPELVKLVADFFDQNLR